MTAQGDLDFDLLLKSWDLQQNAHIKNREDRFQFMLEMVEHLSGETPSILDLACGPGSLSGRFLSKFPSGKSIAVDYDPVLLNIARNCSLYDHDRVTFVEANLISSDWVEKLPLKKFDAILSTTAIHWLPEKTLQELYLQVYSLLENGGVFLNGDHIYPDSESQELKNIFTEIRHSFEDGKFTNKETLNWSDWWEDLYNYPQLKELLTERNKRYPNSDNHTQNISLEQHQQYLVNAGFRNVGVGWQNLDNRVLMAVK